MSAKPEPTDPSPQIDVLVVDQWLIFDCPACQNTIKVEERDAAFEVQCPTCGYEFFPRFNQGEKGSVTSAKRTYSEVARRASAKEGKRRRRRSAAIDHGRRARQEKAEHQMPPSAGRTGRTPDAPRTAAEPGIAESGRSVLPPPRHPLPISPPPEDASRLPVRSPEELERRRVAATVDQRLHPEGDGSEAFDAAIEKTSGGRYKRIRVRTRRKRQTEKQRSRRFYLWVSTGAVAVIGISLYIASLFYAPRLPTSSPTETAKVASTPALLGDQPIGARIDNWHGLMNEFMEAVETNTPEALLKLIRRPHRLESTLLAYYEDGIPDYTGRTILDPPNNGLPGGFRSGQIIMSNQVRPFYLEKTPTHGYRLDWESFEGIGSIPWPQFIENRSGELARMRVIAKEANFFAGSYTDPESYISVRLEDITRKHSVYGYIPKYGPRLRILREHMSLHKNLSLHKEEEVRLILDLRYPDSAKSSAQVEIVELIHDSWLLP